MSRTRLVKVGVIGACVVALVFAATLTVGWDFFGKKPDNPDNPDKPITTDPADPQKPDKGYTELVAPTYDEALGGFYDGLAAVKLGEKWGFIDTKLVIPAQYEIVIGGFSDGYAKVAQNGMYGFIDKTGKLVVPHQYDFAHEVKNGVALVELDGKWGLIALNR